MTAAHPVPTARSAGSNSQALEPGGLERALVALLALAALWGQGEAPGPGGRHGFVILTVEANADVAPVHHRMPVVLAPADFHVWLGAGALPGQVQALVRPAPAGLLWRYAVSSRVNSVSHDDAGLVKPARVEEEAP